MTIVDVINKKRLGFVLTNEELKLAFNGFMEGIVTDYQMSSLLMAICINGMNDEETYYLTDIFINSGDILDLSKIKGVTVDKHSTGGVGDKTTLIIGSIVAACGLKVPKMSGRGLGHTGGTIDKLESIPGFKIELPEKEFIKQVDEIGFAVTSQTGSLAPLDKKVYALRDVTGTVESIPLIASSIMSKKIASGAKNIMIDIKVGKGALLKTKDDALKISGLMKRIGTRYGRNVETMITYMDIPLGTSIGNALEIIEVMDILRGTEQNYLVELSKALASKMIAMGKEISILDAKKEVEEVIDNKKAYKKFLEMVERQGGDINKVKVSSKVQEIHSTKKGHIIDMDAYKFGKLSLELGGGRVTKEDKIDPSVGIVLNKKIGDDVEIGDVICTLYLKQDAPLVDLDITSFYTFEEVSDSVEIVELVN